MRYKIATLALIFLLPACGSTSSDTQEAAQSTTRVPTTTQAPATSEAPTTTQAAAAEWPDGNPAAGYTNDDVWLEQLASAQVVWYWAAETAFSPSEGEQNLPDALDSHVYPECLDWFTDALARDADNAGQSVSYFIRAQVAAQIGVSPEAGRQEYSIAALDYRETQSFELGEYPVGYVDGEPWILTDGHDSGNVFLGYRFQKFCPILDLDDVR